MTPARRQSFWNYFRTGQLVAGFSTAIKGYGFASAGGAGFGYGILGAIGGFLMVIPIAAPIAYVLAWRAEKRGYVDPPPGKTRWLGATLVGLGISAAVFGTAALARYLE